MGRCLVWAMPDGSVRVTRADYVDKRFVRAGESEAGFYSRLFDRALSSGEAPAGVPFKEVDDAAVPWHTKAMEFRAAWIATSSGCTVDMPKARLLRMGRIRTERDRRLVTSDGPYLRAVERGEDVTALKAYRQALRDIPQKTELTVAATPEALAALEAQWPVMP